MWGSTLPLLLASWSAWAQTAPTFQAGMTFELQPCDGTGVLQMFNLPAPSGAPGQIQLNADTSFCVEAWPGSDYGFSAFLKLQRCDAGVMYQQWSLVPGPVPGQGQILTNSTVIQGCLSMNVDSSNLAAGTRVLPYECALNAANEVFTFAGPNIEAIGPDGTKPSGFCVAVKQTVGSYTLDDTAAGAIGAVFDGVGVVAGAGASRLLIDYDPAVRASILDAMFSPTTGAGVHLLKIDVGGNGDGTMGSEPSIMHTENEEPVPMRGTQMWLALEARTRNPGIKLYALPWSWPGWMRQTPTDTTPFATPDLPAAFIILYLTTAQAAGAAAGVNMNFDYVGVFSDIWDGTNSPLYVKALRLGLDTAGFTSTKIVCADVNDWGCATAALADPDLLAAIGVLGDHSQPGNQNANLTGLPVWRSWVNEGGASNLEHAPLLANTINTGYTQANQTATLAFAAFGASYDTYPEWGVGAIRADSPWSGAYYITPNWYVLAHTTQFTQPGWRHLNYGLGSGLLAFGGTYVTRFDASGGPTAIKWSTVIAKTGSPGSEVGEMATFTLNGNLASSTPVGSSVYVFSTCFSSTGTNVTLFTGPTTLPVTGGAPYSTFSLWLDQNCMYTVTNIVGAGISPPPATTLPAAFPYYWSDDFSQNDLNTPGKYWADVSGSFEVVDAMNAGRGLRQCAGQGQPITRRNTDTRPHTHLGDASWRDVDFKATVWLQAGGDAAGFCVRCSPVNDTAGVDGTTGLDHMPGFWLFLDVTGWTVYHTLDPAQVAVMSGTFATPLMTSVWHDVRLVARGDNILAFVDSVVLFNKAVPWVGLNQSPPTRGFVGLAAGDFGQTPVFGAFAVSVTDSACMDMPSLGDQPHEQLCRDGSPAQAFSFTPAGGAPANGPGQFSLTVNNTLCLQMNSTADPEYRYPRTRAITVQQCNPAEPRQMFTIETPSVDGAFPIGPITGIDGLTVNVFGNSEVEDSDVSGYPYQGGENSYWTFDLATGLIYNPNMGTCLGLCKRLR